MNEQENNQNEPDILTPEQDEQDDPTAKKEFEEPEVKHAGALYEDVGFTF